MFVLPYLHNLYNLTLFVRRWLAPLFDTFVYNKVCVESFYFVCGEEEDNKYCLRRCVAVCVSVGVCLVEVRVSTSIALLGA